MIQSSESGVVQQRLYNGSQCEFNNNKHNNSSSNVLERQVNNGSYNIINTSTHWEQQEEQQPALPDIARVRPLSSVIGHKERDILEKTYGGVYGVLRLLNVCVQQSHNCRENNNNNTDSKVGNDKLQGLPISNHHSPSNSVETTPLSEPITYLNHVDTLPPIHANYGIMNNSVQERVALYGTNTLPSPPRESIWQFVRRAISDDLTLQILLIAALVSIILGMTTPDVRTNTIDYSTGWIEGAAILLSALIVTSVNAINDYRKQEQFAEVTHTEDATRRAITVFRFEEVSSESGQIEQEKVQQQHYIINKTNYNMKKKGRESVKSREIAREVHTSNLVVGDVVQISAGMQLTFDALLLHSDGDIIVDEGSVTGENDEVCKHTYSTINNSNKSAVDIFLISGSSILDGSAEGIAVVCAVGTHSFAGEIAMTIQSTEKQNTPLQEQLEEIATLIGKLGMAAAILTFVALLLKELYWTWWLEASPFYLMKFFENLTTAIAIVVVAVPEGLPLSVTISLAYSMRRMLQSGNLVRHLAACETMGGANILCTDKTGTLTLPNMHVTELFTNKIDDKVIEHYSEEEEEEYSHKSINGSIYSNSYNKSRGEYNTSLPEPLQKLEILNTQLTTNAISNCNKYTHTNMETERNNNSDNGNDDVLFLSNGALKLHLSALQWRLMLECIIATSVNPEIGKAMNKTAMALLEMCESMTEVFHTSLTPMNEVLENQTGLGINKAMLSSPSYTHSSIKFHIVRTEVICSMQDSSHCRRLPFNSQNKMSATFIDFIAHEPPMLSPPESEISHHLSEDNIVINENKTKHTIKRTRVYINGAAELVLARCRYYLACPTSYNTSSKSIEKINGHNYNYSNHHYNNIRVIQTLTSKERASHEQRIDLYNQQGLRTVCCAYADVNSHMYSNWMLHDHNTLMEAILHIPFCLLGIIGLQEKIRPEVPQAMQSCMQAGIRVIMITGDATQTAINIAQRCGMFNKQVYVRDNFIEHNNNNRHESDNLESEENSHLDSTSVHIHSPHEMSQTETDELYSPTLLSPLNYAKPTSATTTTQHVPYSTKINGINKYNSTNTHTSTLHSSVPLSSLSISSLLTEGYVLDGNTFRALSDETLVTHYLPQLCVLARATPLDKKRLIQLLRHTNLNHSDNNSTRNHKSRLMNSKTEAVVAVTGDGTNDAPALKLSDVGFAMNSGSEVAKRACDIILLQDSFAGMVVATLWGRNIRDNIRKFLQFQLTVNIAACVISFIGAMLNEQNVTPLKPVQLLWLNLIMDTLAALALATELPNAQVLLHRPPEPKHSSIFLPRMRVNVWCQSTYQLLAQLLLLYHGHAWFDESHHSNTMLNNKETVLIEGHHIVNVRQNNNNNRESNTHEFSDLHLCIVFNAFVWMQVFNFFNARLLRHDEKFNANWRKSKMLLFIVAIIVMLQWGIVEFGGRFMSTVPLTWTQWAFCIAVGSGSLLVGWISRLDKVTLMYFTLERVCWRLAKMLCGTVSWVKRHHNILQALLWVCHRRWHYSFHKSKRDNNENDQYEEDEDEKEEKQQEHHIRGNNRYSIHKRQTQNDEHFAEV